MEKFLLTLLESQGENEHVTKHIIKAQNRQMVKYHFHRTLKDIGYSDGRGIGGKHCLEGYRGLWAEIHSIERLDWEEYQVLDRYVSTWDKV